MASVSPRWNRHRRADFSCARISIFIFYISSYGLSWFIIGTGGWLSIQVSTGSLALLNMPLVAIGVGLLLLFFSFCCLRLEDNRWSLCANYCIMVPLLLAVVGLAIFALVVSSKDSGHSLPGRAYKEYRIYDYSKWLQKKVNNTEEWDKFKRHMINRDVCSKFTDEYQLDTLDEFHSRDLSPIESGCCKPADECNFNYTNPAVWVKPAEKGSEAFANNNTDCDTWSNDRHTLCFDCQSCKGAFIQDVKNSWRFAGLLLIVVFSKYILVLSILLCCFCCNSDVQLS